MSAMPRPASDQRHDVRHPVDLPVKLRCEQAAGRYLSGRTCDLSAGGALIRIDPGNRLRPGQRVHVGVARHRRQALIGADQFESATVVRHVGHGVAQHVALQFDRAVSMPAAA